MNQSTKENQAKTDNMYDTKLYYIKQGVKQHEYDMHQHIYSLGVVNSPKIINYDPQKQVMVMEKIGNMSVSDYYDEYAKGVPKPLMKKIQQIVKTLYDNNIVYPDITGYNFIEFDGKVWIIDFEHAEFKPLIIEEDKHVNLFINGRDEWNPRFR
jgi:tRNA A-37 threonylcarbamoyl transferase component Bud32